MNASVILFDGVCNLCNRSVDFIVRRDPRKRFHFAPLQSEPGRKLLAQHDLPVDTLDTLVLIDEGKAFTRSTAALRIARRLRAPWPIFYFFIIVPVPLRDFFYNAVARRRYRWFGRRETCRVPGSDMEDRFLSS